MALTKEKKKSLMEEFRTGAADTGSVPVQVAILSEDILQLTEHLKTAKKDFSARRGLVAKVSQRRRLLDYLKRMDEDRYKKTIQRLDLRK